MGGIRETNISAMLGYLIHINPNLAEDLFCIEPPVQSVDLELRSDHGEDRYDIVIKGLDKECTVEIKLSAQSPDQLRRYKKTKKTLFAIGSRLQSHLIEKSYHKNFLNWERVCSILTESKRTGKNSNEFFNHLVDDFCVHLKENNMIKGSLEDVYTRDLSGDSVGMYFNQRIYKFQPRFFDKAKNARYFAPYLTGSNSRASGYSVFRTLGIGISFVSKIIHPFLGTEKEIYELLKTMKYSKSDIKDIFENFKWRPQGHRQSAVLFLGEPLRLFQRPVTKFDFWGHSGGAMPSMSIDFGDLIAASNGLFPLSKKKKKK